MARIQRRHGLGSIRLKVSGRLRAADMGRLEHACGDALTREPLQLHLDLTKVTYMDQTAAAVVERLRRRGAQVRRSDSSGPSQETEGNEAIVNMTAPAATRAGGRH